MMWLFSVLHKKSVLKGAVSLGTPPPPGPVLAAAAPGPRPEASEHTVDQRHQNMGHQQLHRLPGPYAPAKERRHGCRPNSMQEVSRLAAKY